MKMDVFYIKMIKKKKAASFNDAAFFWELTYQHYECRNSVDNTIRINSSTLKRNFTIRRYDVRRHIAIPTGRGIYSDSHATPSFGKY